MIEDKRAVAVVIPFYQRRAGLLRRAVNSVARQEGLDRPVHVLVVDDESPFSPAADLDGMALPESVSVEVLRRANGGPGAARNTGVERALELGAAHVAFLDSDDWWEPPHLATALAALADAPFYFANSTHDDVPSFSYFAGMRGRVGGVIPAAEAFPLVLAECVPHTSQVVYSLSRFPDIRFDETMRRTGEDHLFWLTIASRGVPLAYSTRIMGHRGAGVSVYREALGWDAPGYIPRLLDAFHFRGLVASRFDLTPPLARLNARFRREAADEIAYALVRRAAKSPRRGARALAEVARGGPALWAAVAKALPRLRAIRRRVASV